MAINAIIGKNYTFQVLFLDELNLPIVANNPTINLFVYDIEGVRQNLVTDAAMSLAVPAEPGRYTYLYMVPLTITEGDNIHVEMQGIDLDSNLKMFVADVVVASVFTRGSPGMSVRFIK